MRFNRAYTVARQFGRGRMFAALMGLIYQVMGRTPSYRVHWEPRRASDQQ